jgi:hypothetical protein
VQFGVLMLFYTGAEDNMEEDLKESGVLKVLGKIFCYYPSGITVRSAPHPVMCTVTIQLCM